MSRLLSGVCVEACCCVLQCVAVCCSVLQCVAVRCSVLQCVAIPSKKQPLTRAVTSKRAHGAFVFSYYTHDDIYDKNMCIHHTCPKKSDAFISTIQPTAAASGSDTDKSTRSICIFILYTIYTHDDIYDKNMCIHYTCPKKVTSLYIPFKKQLLTRAAAPIKAHGACVF